MAASIEQKVDFLLKKLGYTATKTGIAEDSSLSGTLKAPFAEAIASPLVVPNTSIWQESESIPATPPATDTSQIKGYRVATALQMTADSTVSGNRTFLAREAVGNNSSAMLGDWVDTQFGAEYIINVYRCFKPWLCNQDILSNCFGSRHPSKITKWNTNRNPFSLSYR